jgi:hypothetical protein
MPFGVIQPDVIWSRRRVTEQRFHGLTVTILSLGRLQSHVWLYSWHTLLDELDDLSDGAELITPLSYCRT